MKQYYLLLIFTISVTFINYAQESGSLYLETAIENVDCSGNGCTDITASFLETFSSDSYEIESILYDPPVPFDLLANSVNTNIDDSWSSPQSLPIDFCFFENIEAQFQVGSNGVIRFDVDFGDTTNHWAFTEDLPNNTNPSLGEANIFTPVHDIDPSVSASSEIGWEVFGTYPNRMLVVSFYDVPYFSCNDLRATQMVVLYEASNVMDFYIQEKTVCGSWNNGNAALGIQNNDGTIAFVPPGRNTSDSPWEANNEAWRFKPAGVSPSYVFEWLDDNGNIISNDPTISVCVTEPTTYTAKITYTNCNGAEVVLTDDITVIIEENPIIGAITDFVLFDNGGDGVEIFDLTTKNDEILNGQTEVTVHFFETELDAETFTNPILFPEVYQNLSDPQTIYVGLLNDNNICYNGSGSFDLILDTTVGIEDVAFSDLTIYPNPSSEVIQIQSTSFSSETNVEIYNVQGQVVFSEVKNSATGSFNVNVSSLQTGMYFIKIQSEGNTTSKKLIKE